MRGWRSLCLGGGFTGVQSIVVGLGIAEAAAFAALVGDKGCGALAGGEAAAARGALGIGFANAGDELGSCGCGVEGDWGTRWVSHRNVVDFGGGFVQLRIVRSLRMGAIVYSLFFW